MINIGNCNLTSDKPYRNSDELYTADNNYSIFMLFSYILIIKRRMIYYHSSSYNQGHKKTYFTRPNVFDDLARIRIH